MRTTSSFGADDILWNWARWCWAGETVGNMQPYTSWDETFQPILIEHAQAVDRLHRALPRPAQMVVIAEYPQKNVRFGRLNAAQRRVMARRWIGDTTGVWLTNEHYGACLDRFMTTIEKELL
ncbi:MAG: hypothetical protein GX086_09960 [Alcaligenaceae bacterium]|nr:hypothetical protein [Alcaligenaceae bacterium]